jgi:hypothetical protein
MLNSEELRLVYQRAYIPEHLPNYVEAVSSAESHLHDDYLCFTRGTHLIFIGYPLKARAKKALQSYESACERFHPSTAAVIAPRVLFPDQTNDVQPRDSYYRLDLPVEPLDPELSYMVRRASRELKVAEGTFGKDHKRMVKDFISGHELTQEHELILGRIPHYLKRSGTARLLEARKGDKLEAFTIVDLGSANYAFYLFNFRSLEENIPGASDLLFYEMARLALSDDKKAINLGLGVHPGIRRFKEKWGGTPFLPCCSAFIRRKPLEMDGLVNKL